MFSFAYENHIKTLNTYLWNQKEFIPLVTA